MPAVTSTRHTWTVTVQREPGDYWPDLAAQHAKTLRLYPTRVTLTYARQQNRWVFETIQVAGTRHYRSTTGRPRGTGINTYHAGAVPPGFEGLVTEQRYRAGLDQLSAPDWRGQGTR